jgi:hypothetical protein
MFGFLSKIVELIFPENKISTSKKFVLIFFVVIVLLVGLRYFYDNVKIEQEIRILKELISINTNDISDTRIKEYYESILNKINKKELSIFGITFTNDRPKTIKDYLIVKNIYKFISGSFLGILLFVIGIFSKQKSIGVKIIVQIIFFIIILLLGIVGVFIPSFSPLSINVIGFPLLQIIIIIFIVLATNKSKNSNKK